MTWPEYYKAAYISYQSLTYTTDINQVQWVFYYFQQDFKEDLQVVIICYSQVIGLRTIAKLFKVRSFCSTRDR